MKTSTDQKAIRHISRKLERAVYLVDEGARFVEMFDTLESEVERENCGLLVALAVHNSWHTITQVLKRVALEVDSGTPKGTGAADRLISLMASQTPQRPEIISPALISKSRSIQSFQKEFRRASAARKAPYEIIDLFEAISDEILPNIMQNLGKFMEQQGSCTPAGGARRNTSSVLKLADTPLAERVVSVSA